MCSHSLSLMYRSSILVRDGMHAVYVGMSFVVLWPQSNVLFNLKFCTSQIIKYMQSVPVDVVS